MVFVDQRSNNLTSPVASQCRYIFCTQESGGHVQSIDGDKRKLSLHNFLNHLFTLICSFPRLTLYLSFFILALCLRLHDS